MDPEDFANRHYDRLERENKDYRAELREKMSAQFNNNLIPISADDVHTALGIPMDQLCFIDEDEGATIDEVDKMLGLKVKQVVALERYVINERMQSREL